MMNLIPHTKKEKPYEGAWNEYIIHSIYGDAEIGFQDDQKYIYTIDIIFSDPKAAEGKFKCNHLGRDCFYDSDPELVLKWFYKKLCNILNVDSISEIAI